MNPAQVLLLAKIGVIGVLIVVLYGFGHHQGAKAVQGRWDASKALFLAAQDKLITDHVKDIEKLMDEQDATNRKVSNDHEDALQRLGEKYDRDIAAVAATGGLRLPSSICSGSVATATETASNSGHHEDFAGTVKLPEETERNLFSEAKRADEIVEQLRTCQSWISGNGFYGVATPD